ncbi:MAG: hypothetical protein GY749_38550 [Desulfobacteraceae bacterium]|nr:hypothetical protein [Desulfobacteraceae bacterium]
MNKLSKMFFWSKIYSKEFRRFKLTCQCPACGAFHWLMPFFKKDGSQYSIVNWMWKLEPGSYFECNKCDSKFLCYATDQPVTSEKLKILGIIETDRVEENLGTDRKIIDNSKSSVKLIRKFSINKEWSKIYSIEYEKGQIDNTMLNIGIDKLANIKADFEKTIRKQYVISEERREVYSEEVEIEVPGSIKLTMLLQWKRIWQCGFIKFINQNNEELRVPFRVAVGVTFDQLQLDE